MPITTVANCKAFRGIEASNDEHDAELARLILALQGFLEQKTCRKFEKATLTEYYHGAGSGGGCRYGASPAWRDRLLVQRPPIVSITNIWDDPARAYGSTTLLAAANYLIADAEAGIILLDGISFREGLNNIKITYEGGYAGAIPGIEQEVIELVWAAREKGQHNLIGVRNRSIADGSTQWMNLDWDTSPVAMSVVNKLSLKTGVA